MARLKRKKLNISKAHPPGKPGKPNPAPSSPYEKGKSPHKLAKVAPETKKRFKEAHSDPEELKEKFHGTGWGSKLQKKLLDRHNKGKERDKKKKKK